MGNIHAINASNNEKNLLCLFMAVKKGGPVAIAFAEIYILLNKLKPGQTVEEYCKDDLGYNSKIFGNAFNAEERKKLLGTWNPKSLDVSFLYKLLFHVCDLSSDDQKWINPAYPLEFNLRASKNVRNDTCHDKSELTDTELLTIVKDLEHNVSTAITLAGAKRGSEVSRINNAFKSKMQSYMRKKNPIRVLADSFGFASDSAGSAPGSAVAASASAASAAMVSKFVPESSYESDSLSADEFADQISRDELMEFINEAEEFEFHGISAIIQRQMNQ